MKQLDEILGFGKKKSTAVVAHIGTSYSKADGMITHYGAVNGQPFLHTFKHKTDKDKHTWSHYNGLDDRHDAFHHVHKAIEHSLRNNHGITGHQLKSAHFHEV